LVENRDFFTPPSIRHPR